MSGTGEIVKKVRAALERERRINLHRCPVQIEFQDGILTLEGEMEHVAAKKIALRLAAGVPGVRGIVDDLRVAPAKHMSDGEIRDHVRDALMQDSALQHCLIGVGPATELATAAASAPKPGGVIGIEVKDGVVTLNGQVPSLTHKRLAGVLAWWVPGTRDVINGLEEVPPEEDNDDEITEAVCQVVEKDPFVNAGQIRVRTRDYVVTLEGQVATEAEKDMAELDAWYVLGVNDVKNDLAVRRA